MMKRAVEGTVKRKAAEKKMLEGRIARRKSWDEVQKWTDTRRKERLEKEMFKD